MEARIDAEVLIEDDEDEDAKSREIKGRERVAVRVRFGEID